MGWSCGGQQEVYQRGVLDFANRRTVARPTILLWKLEQCGQAFQALGKRRCMGKVLEALIDEPNYEWLMIDASHIKVHPHATGAEGGNQEMGRTKGGSTPRYIWPWMRMVCQSERLLQRVPLQIIRKLSR
jgi:hypothetical protein